MKYSFIAPIIVLALICAASFHYLFQGNADMLFMAQLQSLFLSGSAFFAECMERPGGLLQWGGTWFTQFFFIPAYGIAMLTALWVLLACLMKRAFSLPFLLTPLFLVPVACLLTAVTDLGYWIYYIRQPGYFFHGTLGYIAIAALLCLPQRYCPKEKYNGSVPAALLAAAAYPLIGYYSVIALACCLVRDCAGRRFIAAAVALALLIVTPLAFRLCYTTMRPDEAFTIGLPIFESFGYTSWEKTMPFIYADVAFVVLAAMKPAMRFFGKPWVAMALGLLAVGGSVWMIESRKYVNENFTAECKMYRAVDEQRWDDALDVMTTVRNTTTREMVILKDIALFNKGDIGNTLFSYNDIGREPYTDDSLHVTLSEVAGPLIYVNHGLMNYATRWCIENSVEFGFSVNTLKILTQAAMATGDLKVAEKYLDILSRTMFYKDWADHYRAMLRKPKTISKQPEMKVMCELTDAQEQQTMTDNGLCEKFIIMKFSNMPRTSSPLMTELALVYAMIGKDIPTFWRCFMPYAHILGDKEMPIHYQEAAYLYGKLEPQTMNTSNMPFDKERIVKRFEEFMQTSQGYLQKGMSQESVGELTYSQYGDTFWWSYYFDRGAFYY